MTVFRVPDMSCGHCKAAIEKAIAGADPAARIDVDLEARSVRVESTKTASELQAAMQGAGYESSLSG